MNSGEIRQDDARATPQPQEASWQALLELPGIEFAWRGATPNAPTQVVQPGSTVDREAAPTWAQLQMSLAQQMAGALDLGKPRVLVTVHERRLLVLGMAPQTQVALVLEDPSSAGMAMVKVRQWLDAQSQEDA